MGVVITNNHTIDVEPERAFPVAVIDTSVAFRGSEDCSYFFRLQCPPGWEVAEWARWQLMQQMRVYCTFMITGGGAKTAKHRPKSQKVFHTQNIVSLWYVPCDSQLWADDTKQLEFKNHLSLLQ